MPPLRTGADPVAMVHTLSEIAVFATWQPLSRDRTIRYLIDENEKGVDMKSKSTATKPSIVFCHGLWADGSCFSKVIPALQAEGHQVIAAQYALNTTADDVATVRSALGRVSSPAILVGHSYGGSVITGAGTDDRVAGLVYIAALAPDADETSQTQQSNFPKT